MNHGQKHRLHYQGSGKERLDVFTSRCVHGLTRSQVRRLTLSGLITVNDRDAKPGAMLRFGDCVEITVPPVLPPSFEAESIPLEILYDDPCMVALNKPAGLVIHPAPGHASGTLAHALLAYYPTLKNIGGPQRAGLVHRLDKHTSGVMVVAKTEDAHRHLSRQFKDRRVDKYYLALVHGSIEGERGIIRLPLGRHKSNRKRISIRTRKPREAITKWEVIRRFPHCSLLKVKPETGRTHQIRVHMAAINHSVVGDVLYGGKVKARRIPNDTFRTALLSTSRHFLHAESLVVEHPCSGQRISLHAPLSKDLTEIIKLLGADDREKFDKKGFS